MNIYTKYNIIINNKKINNFLIKNNLTNCYSILLLCLLKGYTRFNLYNKKIIQSTDYSKLPFENKSKSIDKDFISLLNENKTNRIIFENSEFYELIILEFLQCFYHIKQQNGIASFMHLYRILERISYALPLIYAKSTNNFTKTYELLKKFFANSDCHTGELSFFKNSLKHILDDMESQFPFDLKFNVQLKSWLGNYILDNHSISNNQITFNLPTEKLLDLIVSLRNGLFHSLSGKPHISLKTMPFPNDELLNNIENFLNAISFITYKIVETNYTSLSSN